MLFIRGLAEREGKRRKKRQMSQEEAALRRCVSIRLWYICRAIGTERRAAEHNEEKPSLASLDLVRS